MAQSQQPWIAAFACTLALAAVYPAASSAQGRGITGPLGMWQNPARGSVLSYDRRATQAAAQQAATPPPAPASGYGGGGYVSHGGAVPYGFSLADCGDCGCAAGSCSCGSGSYGLGSGWAGRRAIRSGSWDPWSGASLGCGGCGGAGCDLGGCSMCCNVPRNWFTVDYLGWWTKGNRLPALVTTSPAGTARVDAGVIGVAGTQVLFGNSQIDDEYRSGIRFTLGHWVDPDGTVGIQGSYFTLFDDDSTGDYFNSTAGPLGAGVGLPILARPFFNIGIAPQREDSRLVSFPGVVDGSIRIDSSSEIHSGSLLIRQHFRSDSSGRWDWIGGYRYFRLREGLLIRENQVRTEPNVPIPVGTTYYYEDSLRAENEFHGGDLGVIAQRWSGFWTIEVLAKVALGNLHRSATLSGTNTIDTPPPGGAVTTPGSLLALPTNIGTRTADDFAALPEVRITLRYEPSETCSLDFGYTFLALSDVTRTGELIDRVVNSTQTDGGALVGDARPTSMFDNETDFWAQGFNVGLTFRR